MKAVLLLLCLTCFCLQPASAQHRYRSHARARATTPVHVRATVTRRGRFRRPHFRTAPNHTQRDNWSSKGNRNPFTGKRGHKRVTH